jgi:hypothetical protein
MLGLDLVFSGGHPAKEGQDYEWNTSPLSELLGFSSRKIISPSICGKASKMKERGGFLKFFSFFFFCSTGV